MATSKRNSYQCITCKGIIFTEDQDKGVTPFMLECRATAGCGGEMHSAFYRLPEMAAQVRPHYVWRKPTPKEYAEMRPEMKEHIDNGGLEIYPLAPPTQFQRTNVPA